MWQLSKTQWNSINLWFSIRRTWSLMIFFLIIFYLNENLSLQCLSINCQEINFSVLFKNRHFLSKSSTKRVLFLTRFVKIIRLTSNLIVVSMIQFSFWITRRITIWKRSNLTTDLIIDLMGKKRATEYKNKNNVKINNNDKIKFSFRKCVTSLF